MMKSPFPAGVIGPQPEVTPLPGGIGSPVGLLYERPLWDAPAVQGQPRNLPAPGERLRRQGLNLIGSPGVDAGPSGQQHPGYHTQLVRERHRYADLIETPWNVGTTSVRVLSQPAGLRNMLLLRNISTGAQVISVSFGNVAVAGQSSLSLATGVAVLFDTVVPQNEINAVSDIAGGALMVTYSQYAPT